MSKTHILGVPLDILTERELNETLRQLLYSRRNHIVTPNPEFLLLAQKNQEFFSVLERATLAIPDGIGLKFASWLRGDNVKRYSGSNLVLKLLRVANQKRLRVAVINWRYGLSSDEDIIEAVKAKYPHLKFLVVSAEKNGSDYDRERLRKFRPDIVFTTLGAPEQDIFIRARLLKDISSIRIAMGVGGSFDFITGKAKRAPRFFQLLGLEWLWRVILEPKRLKRIWNAVIIFPLKAVAWQFRRFRYRKNVVALIVNNNNEVLLLNPIRSKRHYWSLVQGGVERGESLEQAMRREIYEETKLTDFTILASFANIFTFDWPKHYTHSGYKGQRQSLFIIKYEGRPGAVKVNRYEHRAFRWLPIDQLLRVVSKVRRQQYRLFLEKYYVLQQKEN